MSAGDSPMARSRITAARTPACSVTHCACAISRSRTDEIFFSARSVSRFRFASAAAKRAFADTNSARACPTSLLSISAITCPRLTLSPTPATRREMRPGTSGPTTAK